MHLYALAGVCALPRAFLRAGNGSRAVFALAHARDYGGDGGWGYFARPAQRRAQGGRFWRRCLPLRGKARCGGRGRRCSPRGARGAAFWPRAVLGDARAWSALERRATRACFCARGLRGLRGLRRALPAPAQGISPLENPQARSSRRSRAPPSLAAGGRPLLVGLSPSTAASAPFRNETKRPCPLLLGHGRVYAVPKALAGGTAALAQGISPLENPQARSSRRSCAPPSFAAGGRPLLVGLSPSTAASAPFGTKRSAHAPFSWGMDASTRCRRRWPAALPRWPPLLTPARE